MKQAVPAQNEDKKVQNFVAQPPKPVAPATQPRKIAIVEKAMKMADMPQKAKETPIMRLAKSAFAPKQPQPVVKPPQPVKKKQALQLPKIDIAAKKKEL